VVAGSGGSLLEREAVEVGGVDAVGGGPAVEAVADVRRDFLFSGQGDEVGDQALLDRVMDLGQASAVCSETRGMVEAGRSSSVATRPGAASAVPEVTMRGRPEPASAAPRVSIARLSMAQFASNLEKS
jgi:hypothetical protein